MRKISLSRNEIAELKNLVTKAVNKEVAREDKDTVPVAKKEELQKRVNKRNK